MTIRTSTAIGTRCAGCAARRARAPAVWLVAGILAACASPRPVVAPPSAAHAAAPAHGRPAPPLDPGAIGRATAAEVTVAPDGVVRIAWARRDVAVSVDGVELRPFAGLASWAAFTPAPGGAMVMVETCAFPDEVDAALDAAFANDLEVTAIHNHFFFDEPRVFFLHLGGMGEPTRLAAGVKAVWDAVRAVRAARPEPATRFGGEAVAWGTMDAAAIGGIIGAPAQTQDGVVKVVIGREGSMHGVRMGGSMGLANWAAFSGADALAAVDGDFIMTGDEVQPVLRALRRVGFHVVALHNHMIGEQPAFYFTHFWAKGPAAELARAFRTVLDAQRAVGRAP